ncbi:unnamed protein product [Trichogramma brassicae]|uniref:Reverse transcriptase RNase H-like domain-containing protein n=1 Tax=Trichogramma brassicae TaxID=86971 RepID=A0A6H5IBT7_9HYME|nr:unnamed protein product [Trichogramma brassicae]
MLHFLPPDACLALQSSCLPSRIFSPRTAEEKGEAWHGARSSRRGIRAHQVRLGFISGTISLSNHPGQPLALHTSDASNTAIGAAVELVSGPRRRRLDAAGFLLAEVITNSAEVLNVRSRAAGHPRGDQIFSEDTRGSKLHHHDRDHRPLSFALEQKSDKFSPRQSRQLDFISRFDAKIVYTPGDENPVADALSRIDAITMQRRSTRPKSARNSRRTNN